ncbi:hypothetical protein C1H46_039795 [Malus baccata]|uniref:Late embryogenesis abundant protein LEA-2 subgroup domain-containing protein n=1 Tax=Malus baccata TaxID=106549 RepID=A0A540KKF0_MALBA|nr:hypothetical protein C1H46_039795 [Malus baccata]
MASSKSEYVFYAPVPTGPYNPQPQQNVVVLTHYRRTPDYCCRRSLRLYISITTSLLLLSAAAFFLYPSDPTVQLARISLNHVRINAAPKPTLDLSFSLTIRVRNRDFFSLNYDSLKVTVGYRARELGFVSSDGGRVRARASSYVNATLVIDGLEVLHDVFYLLEDLAKGVIPFDTDTEVDGSLGLLFFKIPIKARASCEVYVGTTNQTVVREDCYSKFYCCITSNLDAKVEDRVRIDHRQRVECEQGVLDYAINEA